MYNLIEIGKDRYQMHSRYNPAREGSLLEVLTYSVHVLGLSPNELEMALLDMLDNDNDAANFGLNKTFIFSYRRDNARTG